MKVNKKVTVQLKFPTKNTNNYFAISNTIIGSRNCL